MSELLQPLTFPLHGSRLIEASAGTGKTWTIAALYLRLVLGHGADDGFARPLLPPEILVMTFTRAATRELSNRVRERLVQAARHFRGEDVDADPYLDQLAGAYDGEARSMAAHRLMMAAETMDEAAVFTIDAWCQRMLREHAFDSGSLFDEELVSDERALREDATLDYWRQHVYPLAEPELAVLLDCFKGVKGLAKAVEHLVAHADRLDTDGAEPLGALVVRLERTRRQELLRLKDGWEARIDTMQAWIDGQRAANPKGFHGTYLGVEVVQKRFDALRRWAADPAAADPDLEKSDWKRLTPDGILAACNKGFNPDVPDCFDAVPALQAALAALEPVKPVLLRHAAARIARRVEELKRRNRQFGFADMLARLKAALEGPNGEALRSRIVDQYPVAMIDEFQDTSPAQYRIFDLLYRVDDNDPARGLFLIGDPKQSIYGFRGADIHSYLDARRATAGRHYQLGTNFRSAARLVAAVNRVFLHAEGGDGRPGHAAGAFRFRKGGENPLPFEPVGAAGRKEALVGVDGPLQALAVNASAAAFSSKPVHMAFFADHCAEHIVRLLDDAHAGFRAPDGAFARLQPADIAVLVRDRNEAAAIRQALDARKVRSVYLSDKDSVLASPEAADVLRWLKAVASPLDGTLARAAFASATCGLALAELVRLAGDEQAWEQRVEQLKALHVAWQRQGVLAMLRRFIHELDLPARLLATHGGERSLTNLLHLAELLQEASRELDGEQALIRWFGERMEEEDENDELVLRLESDAELVKVITVYKSKGLEYPLVYLPFAASARKAGTSNRSFLDYVDDSGKRRLDLDPGAAALAAADRERLDEEVRLLYVALTRARHFLWLGVAARAGQTKLRDSALGWLLAGGAEIAPEALAGHWEALRGDAEGIEVRALADVDGITILQRKDARPDLVDAVPFDATFERNWSVGSFTSLTRHTVAPPSRAQEETLMDEPEAGTVVPVRAEDAPWHRFPRGSTPGNFLHEQLEWLAQEGFGQVDDPEALERLAQRIGRAGWGNRLDDALAWLKTVATTRLPPLDAALADIALPLPEMEFWFPSRQLNVGALDALCRRHLLGNAARPALSGRDLHGMLKGFMDLVFEHEGRYWVLDYKSNALGPGDASYTRAAMVAGMAAHRYDIQGAIYLLALHRLLRARLGDGYDPARQLGGAVFLFLRGIANPATHGCYAIEPDLALLDGLDRLLGDGRHHED